MDGWSGTSSPTSGKGSGPTGMAAGSSSCRTNEVRAYFKGKYSRLRELTDEDRKQILSPEQI